MSTPSPATVRACYTKIIRAHRALQAALNEAHKKNVLRYADYTEESPCSTHFETFNRIEETCERALLEVIKEELSNKAGWP